MKNVLIYILAPILNFFFPYHGIGQWDLSGNSINVTEWFGAQITSTIPVSFEHRANIGAASRFVWSTHNGTSFGERMQLTNTGFLGLNTTSPSALFHMDGGALLNTGTVGGVPVSGTGTRMMWVPALQAFRAGEIDASNPTAWDAANVGQYSFAFGLSPEASGNSSR